MRVVYWGTYDTGKPRNRIILKGLRENNIEIIECHSEIWRGVEDKSQLKGFWQRLQKLFRWFLCYPSLIYRYLRLPAHDAVLIGYLGQIDVLVLFPFARLRGVPVVWDAFLSLYDSVVWDRKIISPYNPLAFVLYIIEWLACRAADRVVLDTFAQENYFKEMFRVKSLEKMQHVLVGAEIERFAPKNASWSNLKASSDPFTILFYGQFIPLHGIEFIIRAAKLTENTKCQWILIGKGQESEAIKQLCLNLQIKNIHQIDWVPYEKLVESIHNADVGLGIFGNTDKAKRVIPNKVFQLLAAGCPIITGDTPAARELLVPSEMVHLVPVGDHEAIADKVMEMIGGAVLPWKHDRKIVDRITPSSIGNEMKAIIAGCTCRV